MAQYSQAHTFEWAAKITAFDGFVIVTPEYNHSTSGVLKTPPTSVLDQAVSWSAALAPLRAKSAA